MRYLAKQGAGKNGENLYPLDPDTLVKVDMRMAINDDFLDSYKYFTIPRWMQEKNKDDEFIAYITKKFPEYL